LTIVIGGTWQFWEENWIKALKKTEINGGKLDDLVFGEIGYESKSKIAIFSEICKLWIIFF
jgi:hypothetical protein